MHDVLVPEPVLVVDIGNTNIVCAIYHEGVSVWTVRLQSNREKTADEYYALLNSMITEIPFVGTEQNTNPLRSKDIRYICVGSVVPELTRVWKHLFRKYFTAYLIEVNSLSPLGMKFKVPNPEFIGADLIANAYSAWKKYDSSAIIVDLGTATTIQVVSKTGIFEGAIIAPGLKTGAANMFSRAAQLYELEMVKPPVLLGTNTTEAMLSGIVYGHAFMVETYINKLKQQYFDHTPILAILSGGMADLLRPMVPSADIIDKSLTMDGFYLAMQTILKSK